MATSCCLSIYLSLWLFHLVSLSSYPYGYSTLSLFLPVPIWLFHVVFLSPYPMIIPCCSSIYLSLRLYHAVSLYISMAILYCIVSLFTYLYGYTILYHLPIPRAIPCCLSFYLSLWRSMCFPRVTCYKDSRT